MPSTPVTCSTVQSSNQPFARRARTRRTPQWNWPVGVHVVSQNDRSATSRVPRTGRRGTLGVRRQSHPAGPPGNRPAGSAAERRTRTPGQSAQTRRGRSSSSPAASNEPSVVASSMAAEIGLASRWRHALSRQDKLAATCFATKENGRVTFMLNNLEAGLRAEARTSHWRKPAGCSQPQHVPATDNWSGRTAAVAPRCCR